MNPSLTLLTAVLLSPLAAIHSAYPPPSPVITTAIGTMQVGDLIAVGEAAFSNCRSFLPSKLRPVDGAFNFAANLGHQS
jgi:hypothetical protein